MYGRASLFHVVCLALGIQITKSMRYSHAGLPNPRVPTNDNYGRFLILRRGFSFEKQERERPPTPRERCQKFPPIAEPYKGVRSAFAFGAVQLHRDFSGRVLADVITRDT